MKKKSRNSRSTETSWLQKTGDTNQKRRPNRGRPRKGQTAAADGPETDPTASTDPSVAADEAQKHAESVCRSTGRLSAAVCRLCHGKFSSRSLRHAFHKLPQDPPDTAGEADAAAQSALLFHSDFQRLVGVRLDRDPRLSEFICKKCHAKFYKCHSILIRFLQRVNLPAVGKENLRVQKNAKCPESSLNCSSEPPAFTSDPKCLHSLVSWAHRHGEACRFCPHLQEVLEGRCWGSVQAVWGCEDGHRYTMDTRYSTPPRRGRTGGLEGGAPGSGDGEVSEENEEEEKQPSGAGRTASGDVSSQIHSGLNAATEQNQNPAQDEWTGRSQDAAGLEERTSPAPAQMEDQNADSDLSDRLVSEEELEEGPKGSLSDEEMFEPFAEKRTRRINGPDKTRRSLKSTEEPKVRKKPGPKPGWKNKFKPKGEELPNIYKCPYQGCTAVYRAPDGLKKHIKEHHEEMRERPCPHPGCNKVFMIDRYLQRHMKLIHTEERNYICDQCGQTFKQRKHLSVHQMRHSGAKPLQCEVCGFQCRQRASLKYHMTKHKAEADLEFECLMCQKRFEKAHNLNVHMSMVHPLTQADGPRGGAPQPYADPHADLHTITLTGELVQQDGDR
ncbi:zinc finger protein 276 [Oryzias melastigma]|uniref:zinc finger protein 276 n=1 Tax=Oryzias melastigma TaxID=30732 RepID=UPI000CF82B5E|nr:zinc finger protein 276 [Oryzias melastigma]